MIGLAELLAKKAQYEHEKLFVEAKISVVDEMIAEERAKTAEEPIAETEEVVEETTQQDESY